MSHPLFFGVFIGRVTFVPTEALTGGAFVIRRDAAEDFATVATAFSFSLPLGTGSGAPGGSSISRSILIALFACNRTTAVLTSADCCLWV